MNAEFSPAQRFTERAVSQRERILVAAQACFVKHGFHAAGMAAIAEAADMSPGLIYRYFENKNAIILAIIERQLEESCSRVCALQTPDDFAAAVMRVFDCWKRADPQEMNAALFLEMTAEATRDPSIAAALHASDLTMRRRIGEWMGRAIDQGGLGLAPDVAQIRALSLQSFVEGLAVRAIREPDLAPEVLKVVIDNFLAGLAAH